MPSTSRGAWVVLATLMATSALRGLGSLLGLGMVALLAGSLDGLSLGLANGLVSVGIALLAAVALLWIVARVSPREPTLVVTVAAVSIGLVGWGVGYGASLATNVWVARWASNGSADVAAFYQVSAPIWMLTSGIEQTSMIAALIIAHVKGIASDPR